MIKMTVAHPDHLKKLLDAKAYESLVGA
jgi:hypothetical protein